MNVERWVNLDFHNIGLLMAKLRQLKHNLLTYIIIMFVANLFYTTQNLTTFMIRKKD